MGKVSESIYSGVNCIIPMADVVFIQREYSSSGEAFIGLNVIMKGTRWSPELENWDNCAFIKADDAPKFMRAWCDYRAELEAETLMDPAEMHKMPDPASPAEILGKIQGIELDGFAKAFLDETGLKPSEAVLVQKATEKGIEFFFRKIEPTEQVKAPEHHNCGCKGSKPPSAKDYGYDPDKGWPDTESKAKYDAAIQRWEDTFK